MPETLLNLGTDQQSGDAHYLNVTGSRAIFICGKRGSGKSYSMGVIIEEIFDRLKGEALMLIADPMGIYHTMVSPNTRQSSDLRSTGRLAKGFPLRLIVPGDPVSRYGDASVVTHFRQNGAEVVALQINPSDLSPEGWCELFDISINEAMGITLWRAVDLLREKDRPFSIHDIVRQITNDARAKEASKEALENRLNAASRWGIFSENPVALTDLFSVNHINVLDLSVLDAGTKSLRNMVLNVVTQRLFAERTRERRREEFGLNTKLPRVWLAIDEAHQFVPTGRTSLCKEMLVRWVKEGRQPGLGLIVATQQPAAMDSELLSQCDVILSHKITSWEDINALDRLSATYVEGNLKIRIRALSRRGEALLVDDEAEAATYIKVRPRLSAHGGGETHETDHRQTLF